MRYTIDEQRGIIFEFDDEPPEISIPDAVKVLQDISAQIEMIGAEPKRDDATVGAALVVVAVS